MSKSGERNAPGVGPVFPEKDQAINYAQNRASFHAGEIRILTRPAMSNAAYFFSSTTIRSSEIANGRRDRIDSGRRAQNARARGRFQRVVTASTR
jgi:hypothetical protein